MEILNSLGYVYIMSIIQSMLFAYFLCVTLPCENKRKRFIKIVAFFSLIIHPISFFIFKNLFLKALLVLVSIVISFFAFFKESSYFKKAIAFVLLILTVMSAEMIVNVLFYLIHGFVDFLKVPVLEYIGWQILDLTLCFFCMYLVIHYIKIKNNMNGKEKIILFSILTSQFILIYATAIEVVDKGTVSYFDPGSIFLILSFSCVLSFHCFLIYHLIKNYHKKVEEMTVMKMREEYKEQLKQYLQNEDRDIRYLRHDIINFIEQQKGNE